MGSDTLSCTFLTALIHAPDVDVAAVVTQPDRERGRRMQVLPGPVKDEHFAEAVLTNGILRVTIPKADSLAPVARATRLL